MVHNNDIIVASAAALAIATFIPTWRIIVRVGLPRWWSFVALVPFVGALVILWMICNQPWPKWSANAPRP
jgi:uncharacterized membrane protein YhaH (DUF805 family)